MMDTVDSEGEEELHVADENKLAYLKMSPAIYYSVTLGLYMLQIVGAIMISDVATIFEAVSAVSITSISFIFPGLFYLQIESRYASEKQKEAGGGTRRMAQLFIALGVICFFLITTKNMLAE